MKRNPIRWFSFELRLIDLQLHSAYTHEEITAKEINGRLIRWIFDEHDRLCFVSIFTTRKKLYKHIQLLKIWLYVIYKNRRRKTRQKYKNILLPYENYKTIGLLFYPHLFHRYLVDIISSRFAVGIGDWLKILDCLGAKRKKWLIEIVPVPRWKSCSDSIFQICIKRIFYLPKQ